MMAAEMETLTLRLEGALQAWGDSSRWSIRDTRPEPTKSGVLGLIAACLGWRLDADSDRRMGNLAERLRLGVRADREGVMLRDYHTIGGSRSGAGTPWVGLLTAEGRVKKNPASPGLHTEVSERNYLSDACFLIALEGESSLIYEIESALVGPVWPPFLGRKSCVPSAPLYPAAVGVPGRAPTALLEVLRNHSWLGRDGEALPATVRVVVDEGEDATEGMRGLRYDVPESVSRRFFGHRYVREFTVACPRKE